MKSIHLDYGDAKMEAVLPDSSEVVQYGLTYQDPPEIDAVEAVRMALRNPLGCRPLKELVKSRSRIVIGFPDKVKGGMQKLSHRRVAIPLIIEELLDAGADIHNITLLCAMGLHRKNTLQEWYEYLGRDIVDQFYPDRLVNHDAEDSSNLLDFGQDQMGNYVECSRLLAEADIPIIIGHCAGNPYGGFSGGYKMLVTGHTGQKSIGSHHTPKTMHRDDWLGASPAAHMRHQFRSIGTFIEEKIGKKIFAVDAVIGQRSQVIGVAAGTIDEVEKATWPLAMKRTNVELDMKDRADVLVIGIPRNFHYGPGMGSNPVLTGLAIAGQLSRCWNVLHQDSVIIAASVCDGWFNEAWFPSYEQTYEKMISFQNPEEFLRSDDQKRISYDYRYRWMYSNCYTYHPFHAMSMISGYGILRKRTQAVIMAGAKKPQYARSMGYRTVGTFNEGMEEARRLVGKNPKILCTPECFSGGVGVHLYLKGEAESYGFMRMQTC